ncbi:MAG: hypothetical protein ACR2P2_08840 [Nakamurella sp.]
MNIQDRAADDGAANGTIPAINLGSASLRAAVHNRDGHRLPDLHVDRPNGDGAVAHRVVHRGPRQELPTRADDPLLDDLQAALALVP